MLVVAGDVYDSVPAGLAVVSLSAAVGQERSLLDPLGAIREVLAIHFA